MTPRQKYKYLVQRLDNTHNHEDKKSIIKKLVQLEQEVNQDYGLGGTTI